MQDKTNTKERGRRRREVMSISFKRINSLGDRGKLPTWTKQNEAFFFFSPCQKKKEIKKFHSSSSMLAAFFYT